ncbi:MAG TPA: CHAT domain-containing protein [Thermoanaerobaculia bacterium]|nr:CHAT domain-containing protein [Thermoanaerobaculia bacterium]
MRVLRLRHSLTAGGGSLVAVDYDPGQGASGYTSQVPLLFDLGERDRSRLRFYLENFLTCPNPAALKPAADLRADLRHWGEELFQQVFKNDRKALFHYQEATRDLHSLRIEVLADHPQAWTVPWELLYDPNLGWLAPQARSFVRRLAVLEERETWIPQPGEPLRVLYVVGRPAGSLEIPFHSVARSVLQIAADLGDRLRIDFLRPPTFERLAKVMSEAAEAGRPYHVLHFDGHGVFTESPQDFAGELDPGFVQEGDRLVRRPWTRRRGGARGYLIFEDLEGGESRRLVDGVQIGNLVARTHTSLVVLHACQSATARVEALERMAADPTGPGRCPASPVGEAPDDHDQDLAYQSLTAEIMRSVPRAVVALPWTLPPFTATRVLSGLYGRIAEGLPVGESVTAIRAELLNGVRRESVLGSVEMDDWLVPLVHESVPLPICDPGHGRRGRSQVFQEEPPPGTELPPAPAWGFVDRPEVLFTLDRAFDVHGTVLLHAFAGAGKTSLAREFAHWYRQSGGVGGAEEPGVLLWSSFDTYDPAAPFEAFETGFAGRLLREGVWAAAGREERRTILLNVLREEPAFWVWDNVELVGGFPPEPLWSQEERTFLADLLRDLSETRCKVLLVGRRAEEEWLGDLPWRITLPPMPMEERGELTIRIAAQHGLAPRELMSFAPLLRLSEGNPLTLAFLLGEALSEGLRKREEVNAFVADLRLETKDGEPSVALLSSLRYGYESAFEGKDRERLALLHLFRGCVDLNVLCWMGHPEAPWCLAPVRDLGRETWTALLDRAAEAGLLASRGGDSYGVHPALPFFFRGLFERFWNGEELAAARAFTESVAGLGSYYRRKYQVGNRDARDARELRDVIAGLLAQEANLLQARALARRHGWWSAVVHAMEGLETLYRHTGRDEEWKRLLRETVPEFVDPVTEEPLPGREEFREVMNVYVTLLTGKERD